MTHNAITLRTQMAQTRPLVFLENVRLNVEHIAYPEWYTSPGAVAARMGARS